MLILLQQPLPLLLPVLLLLQLLLA
jgi:hypothetical protein